MNPTSRERFFELLRTAAHDGSLTKLTLGKYRGADASLKNLFVRPVTLKSGPHLSFTWRHETRDITKNHTPDSAVVEIDGLLGRDFLDAHLFTATQQAQYETQPDGKARLKLTASKTSPPTSNRGHGPQLEESAQMETRAVPALAPVATTHDRSKSHLIASDAPWLRALGVTNDRGQPREGMADKFRQIQKYAELLSHLLPEAFGDLASRTAPLEIADMGSGKGYLTFAVATFLGRTAHVHGIEARPALVELCNRAAREHGLAEHLEFEAGTIADAKLDRVDVLIALHACDTATDDALARGVERGAQLLVVSPCCQKELRRQLRAPEVLSDALRHGIFQERQAEFVTDALRAQLLEWAGYRTKVFEFISTDHTAKNLMIAAIKLPEADATPERREAIAERIRAFAQFYGVESQCLAQRLGFELRK